MAHRVFFSDECHEAAKKLGGYEAIDDSLNVFFEDLHRNPRGFPYVESEWTSFRYVPTNAVGRAPKLIWYFIIDHNEDVILTHVEAYEESY
jgi:hypothetical protein